MEARIEAQQDAHYPSQGDVSIFFIQFLYRILLDLITFAVFINQGYAHGPLFSISLKLGFTY